jgi:hypothetical protein
MQSATPTVYGRYWKIEEHDGKTAVVAAPSILAFDIILTCAGIGATALVIVGGAYLGSTGVLPPNPRYGQAHITLTVTQFLVFVGAFAFAVASLCSLLFYATFAEDAQHSPLVTYDAGAMRLRVKDREYDVRGSQWTITEKGGAPSAIDSTVFLLSVEGQPPQVICGARQGRSRLGRLLRKRFAPVPTSAAAAR